MTVANFLHGWSFDKETLPKHLGLEELPGDDELLDYLLEIDIREYGLPVLVDIQSSMKNLPRDLVLQVKKFKNICVPESSLNSEMFDATSKAILRYYLTDGHTTISAVALDSDIKLRKGTKVLFHKHCSMETGFIMMNTKYFTVLGGGIKEVEKKTQIVDGEESKILRSAPKFADLMKSMAKNFSMSRSEPRTENVGSSKQPSQTVQEVDPVSEPKHNARRDVPSGGKPPKEKNRLPKSFGHDSRQQSRGSRSGPAKGRGEFHFNTNDQKPQRMVYEDYEHDIGQSLTFTRSSGNAGGSSVCRAEARRGQDRRPRTEPREQRDNRMEHRNNRNEERGQHSSSGRGRGSSGGRGGNRGGRGGSGSGPSRGRGGGQRMQGGGSYGRTYSPAQPQFNTMNELDFPSLGDAVFGMHLH